MTVQREQKHTDGMPSKKCGSSLGLSRLSGMMEQITTAGMDPNNSLEERFEKTLSLRRQRGANYEGCRRSNNMADWIRLLLERMI